MTDNRTMSKTERDELARLARLRAKVARTEVDQRAAELRADVEAQLSAIYAADDAAWRDITAAAKALIDEADTKIAAKCQEMGIPNEFRPGLSLRWHGRGENGLRDRQAELRRRAYTRIEAEAKSAKTTIETRSLDVQTRIIAEGLTSDAARQFLAEMPTPAALMPSVSVEDDLREIESSRRTYDRL